ncbi:MAG: ATP-dependent Clp protease adaptor ClpS [Bacteroidota bacterium]
MASFTLLSDALSLGSVPPLHEGTGLQWGERSLSPGPQPTVAAPETASPDVEVLEEEDDGTDTDAPWTVILFNDEVHTFQEVITQLVKATGCTSAKAEKLAWTVHTKGKATVYEGSFQECFDVQAILNEINLITEIRG